MCATVVEQGGSERRGQGWAAGMRFGERYLVEGLIGEGGWAETYRGRDLLLERPVALKLLRTQFAADPALVDRFEREARIAAAISHPNVVAVYDYGTQDGVFFIALQFIAGEDLKHLLVRRGRLPTQEAGGVTIEILKGLGAIHRAGIVHRDVKPQNVLLGEDSTVRITDFGIAHQSLATRVTSHGDAIGTASYMAPEQARGEEVSAATDVYAVGVVLYELLTGQLPFEREHAMATLLAHIQEPPPSPRVVAPDAGISPEIEAVVLRALAKDPAARFASAPAMLQTLTTSLGGSLVSTATQHHPAAGRDPMGTTTRGVPGLGAAAAAAAGAAVSPTGTIAAPFGSSSGSPPGHVPPSAAPAPGPSRRGWAVALALVLVALAGLAAVAVANLGDGDDGAGGGENGGNPAAERPASPSATAVTTIRTIQIQSTATASATVPASATATRTPPPPPRATATPAPTAPPTETPPATATTRPTVPPTETPPATATTPPTRVPTEPPDPTATEEPPAPTDAPIPEVEEAAVQDDAEPFSEPVLLAADAWQGGAGQRRVRNDRGSGADEVTAIEAGGDDESTAALTFDLGQVPADGVTIELQTRLLRTTDGPAPLGVQVNGTARSAPIDVGAAGEVWSTVRVVVPAAALVAGENRIVVEAQESTDARGRTATILLGDVTVTPGLPTSESADGAAPPETPEPVVPDSSVVQPTSRQQPTITPR